MAKPFVIRVNKKKVFTAKKGAQEVVVSGESGAIASINAQGLTEITITVKEADNINRLLDEAAPVEEKKNPNPYKREKAEEEETEEKTEEETEKESDKNDDAQRDDVIGSI